MKPMLLGVLFLALSSAALAAFDLEIIEPEAREYLFADDMDEANITVRITANETLDMIELRLDDGEYMAACENCSSHSGWISVDQGEHVLTVRGRLENQVVRASTEFSARMAELGLQILSPRPINYSNTEIELKFTTEERAALKYVLDGQTVLACADCDYYREIVTLSPGAHTLRVAASRDGLSETKSVRFQVMEKAPEERNWSRFRFEKLPEHLERGELDDNELAEILKDRLLPPGIINRLIKTGKLGNESINAILEHQFNPPGIMMRLLAFLGLGRPTYAQQIHEMYRLNEASEHKLLMRDDLPKRAAEDIRERLQKQTNLRLRDEAEVGNAFRAASQAENKTRAANPGIGMQISKAVRGIEIGKSAREQGTEIGKSAREHGTEIGKSAREHGTEIGRSAKGKEMSKAAREKGR